MSTDALLICALEASTFLPLFEVGWVGGLPGWWFWWRGGPSPPGRLMPRLSWEFSHRTKKLVKFIILEFSFDYFCCHLSILLEAIFNYVDLKHPSFIVWCPFGRPSRACWCQVLPNSLQRKQNFWGRNSLAGHPTRLRLPIPRNAVVFSKQTSCKTLSSTFLRMTLKRATLTRVVRIFPMENN